MEEKNVQVVNEEKNIISIVGFVISIVSIILCGVPSIVGLILSILGLNKSKKVNGKGKGLSIAGIIISAIMMLVFIVLVIVISLGVFSVNDTIKNVKNQTNHYTENYDDEDKQDNTDYDEDDNDGFDYDSKSLDLSNCTGDSCSLNIGSLNFKFEKFNKMGDDIYSTRLVFEKEKYEYNRMLEAVSYSDDLILFKFYDTDITGNLYVIFDKNGNELAKYDYDMNSLDKSLSYSLLPTEAYVDGKIVVINASTIANALVETNNGSFDPCDMNDIPFAEAKYEVEYNNGKLNSPVQKEVLETLSQYKSKYCKY